MLQSSNSNSGLDFLFICKTNYFAFNSIFITRNKFVIIVLVDKEVSCELTSFIFFKIAVIFHCDYRLVTFIMKNQMTDFMHECKPNMIMSFKSSTNVNCRVAFNSGQSTSYFTIGKCTVNNKIDA